MDFQRLASAYFAQQLKEKPCYDWYCRLFRQYFSAWGDHKTRFELRAWHLSLKATPSQANKALGMLKAMYAWGQITGDATGKAALWPGENPATGVRRHSTQSRERVFSDTELVQFFIYHEFASIKVQAYTTLLLCTACRMSEARLMQWSHLDLAHGFWFKPNTKNGTSHRLPLPLQAVTALQQLPRCGVYVFPGLYGRPWSRAAAEKAWGIFRKQAELPGLTLHDMRRTVASRVYDQTKDEKLVKAILNHSDHSMSGIYIRMQYSRVAAALQAHADALWTLRKETLYAPDRPMQFHTQWRTPDALPHGGSTNGQSNGV